jgi:hypothetical protein
MDFILCDFHLRQIFEGFLKPVLRILIRRIHMFLGLQDPHPDPLVRDMDPDPDQDPSIIKKKY